MANRLYEQYERLYLQQAELFEENAVAGVRAAFGDFNRGYLQILRSVTMSRQTSSQASGTRNVNLLTRSAQKEMDAARDLAQRQLATALANGFGAIANLPFSANEPTVSGTSNQEANAEQEADNPDSVSIKSEDLSECESDCENVHSVEIKEEIEDQTEMATIAGTSIVNSNIDNVSVNREITPASSDSVSNDEVELTGDATDETMRHSECEQVNMENDQTRDLNFAAISLPRPLVPYELSDEEEDNERKNVYVASFDLFNGHLPSNNDSVHPLIAFDSTFTRRYQQSRNKVKAKFAELISSLITQELPVDTENLDLIVNSNGKRTNSLSPKLSTPKRAHVEPEVDVAEEESGPLSIIVHHLNCPVTGCKKTCPDKVQLSEHLLVKHKVKKRQCKVKGCNQSFAKQSELTHHRKSAHRKLKKWPCDKCETTWKNYSELTSHHGKCHQQGLFQCSADKCAFTGQTRKSVQNHQRRHGSVKYECPFADCSVSFKRKSHLTGHLRGHNQERPFACEECHKAFTRKELLTAHERIHSGLKPFHCKWPGCDYSASDRSNVRRHVRTVHFGLPALKKQQDEQKIIDTRDAGQFIEKMITN